MTKVTWIGKPGLEEYHGTAGDADGGELHLTEGLTIECTAGVAEYLQATFGDAVLIEKPKPKPRPRKKA